MALVFHNFDHFVTIIKANISKKKSMVTSIDYYLIVKLQKWGLEFQKISSFYGFSYFPVCEKCTALTENIFHNSMKEKV